jgi:ribosomal protein S17E
MTAIINGSSPSITFSDSTTQATSAVVGGKVPYSILPTGSVLQVVNAACDIETSNSSGTQIATGLTATITPKFSTSKILVIAMLNGATKNTNNTSITSYLTKNAGNLKIMSYVGAGNNSNGFNEVGTIGINYLDSPATTSATTYACTFASQQSNAIVYMQIYGATSTITLMEIAG